MGQIRDRHFKINILRDAPLRMNATSDLSETIISSDNEINDVALIKIIEINGF